MPDRVTLREAGDLSSKDARLFSSAYASDFKHYEVLENILDPNLPLTPGITLCGTAPSKVHPSKKKQPSVQIMCLGLNLDPVTELVELFHGAIEGVRIEGPVLQITDGFAVRGQNQPYVFVIGSRAQGCLQAHDPGLASILTDVITTCPDMTCVLSDGTITRASELSVFAPARAPKSGAFVPESMPGDETNNEEIQANKNTPSDDPEPGF